MTDQIANMIIVAVICIVPFLLLREVVCWYFKINERVALLKKLVEVEHIKPDLSSKHFLTGYPGKDGGIGADRL